MMTFLRGAFFVMGCILENTMGVDHFDLFPVCLCFVPQTVPVELLSLFLTSLIKSRFSQSIFGIRTSSIAIFQFILQFSTPIGEPFLMTLVLASMGNNEAVDMISDT